MNEKLLCSRNWTIQQKALAALWLTGSSSLALIFLVFGWPVVFVPKLWDGYTCWNEEEC